MHKKTHLRFLLSLVLLSAALTATSCTSEDSEPNYQPIDRQTATTQANLYISTHARGATTSASFIDDSTLAHQGVSQAGLSSSESTSCVADPQGNWVCEDTPASPISLKVTDDADDMVRWFADNVFNDARVTDAQATRITYTLAADLFCARTTSITFPGDPTAEPTGDSDCAQAFAQTPLQVELRSLSADLLQATLVVSGARPLTVTLSPTSASIEVDLAAVKAAANALAQPELQSMFAGLSMQGRVKVELSRLNDQHYSAAISVTQAINITGDISEGARFSLKLQPSSITLDADNASKRVSISTRVGALDLDMPYSSSDDTSAGPSPAPSTVGTLSVHIDGATANASFDGAQDTLTLQDISLGQSTSTVKLNGQNILSIDLNPDMGRALDLVLRSVSSSAGDIIEAAFTPGAHVKLLLALQNASNIFGGDIPSWGRNETLEVRLDGSPSPTLQLRDGVADNLKVIAGRLTLSATSLPSPVVIDAGQCVAGFGATEDVVVTDPAPPIEPDPSSPAHPFSSLAPVACE